MAILSSPLQYLAAVPPVTRAWTAATVVSTLFYFWVAWKTHNDYAPYITLVPGSSIFYPWTFFSSALVETSIIELVVTLIVIPASLRYLERLWGTIETIKFMVVSIVVSNVIAFAFNWIEFAATRNADLFLYGMQYHGQMSLLTAVLVAFTQVIPEHQVQIMGVIKTRVKQLPMAYLTFSTVMTIIGFQCPYIVIQFAWLVSWVWLRFYKKNTGDVVGGGDSYGDRSETFALIYWFPPFAHKPISVLANTTYALATKLHLIPVSGSDVESGGYSQVPGSARAEAERRRAMALKALDQRMAGSSGTNSQTANNSPSQPLRAPPPAASHLDSPAMPSSQPTKERQINGSESNIGEIAKPKEESR